MRGKLSRLWQVDNRNKFVSQPRTINAFGRLMRIMVAHKVSGYPLENVPCSSSVRFFWSENTCTPNPAHFNFQA